MPIHLSKSRYLSGLQCSKQLWWKVHEPKAPELVPDEGLAAVLTRGNVVGELARTYFPGGVLIDLPAYAFAERVEATRAAIAQGAPAIYEASFLVDGVFCAVDILQRKGRGYSLVEVKSTLDVKDEHIPDAAVQLHVLRGAGLSVKRVDIMHLNRECRHPDLSNLFVRKNVTRQAEKLLPAVPKKTKALFKMLQGPTPKMETGPHCSKPYECAFMGRCWPAVPDDHVSTLYRISQKKLDALSKAGHRTIPKLPETFEAGPVMKRQIASVTKGRLVVEARLTEALRAIVAPIAFLDFETIAPAVPVWPGCGPYEQVPVQFSCHVVTRGPRGMAHHAWLADGPGDPRPVFAKALVEACADAKTVVAYNAPFEKRCITSLIAAVPKQRKALESINARMVDLLPIVRDNVYHPSFGGSFSIKSVLPALVKGLGYEDLEIQNGGVAATALEGMLLEAGEGDADEDGKREAERKRLRKNLLAYCERDTFAMVKLWERLGEVAGR